LSPSESFDREAPGWRRSIAPLKGIAAYCRERDLPLVVFLYEHVPSAKTDALRDDIAHLAATEGFPFSSTKAWLATTTPWALVNSAVDAHPNAIGHARLATGMHEFLLGLEVVRRRIPTG
jgi:hypothetical protein